MKAGPCCRLCTIWRLMRHLFSVQVILTAGDFAIGIVQLKNAGCKVIVDDITYITAPYYDRWCGGESSRPGCYRRRHLLFCGRATLVKSPMRQTSLLVLPVPSYTKCGIPTGQVHDFGGGNPYQTLYLEPGNYTIVLQWKDAHLFLRANVHRYFN